MADTGDRPAGVRFRTVATLLGNPVYWGSPYQDHTPAQLAALRDLGVNTLFINMAWSRPWMDVVNLEDLHLSACYPWLGDAARARQQRDAMRRRVDAAMDAGLRPFFLFGCPKQIEIASLSESQRHDTQPLLGASTSRIDPRVAVACIQSEAVRDLYADLLGQHFQVFPETAGLLIYNVDELAEVCDERDDCPRCLGVPLHERLPAFLHYLVDVVHAHSPEAELWWEPWEFSAAQTLDVVRRLRPAVRLALHKCIHEVYFAGGVDAWFRQIDRLAAERGIEIIAELFWSGTGEDLGPLPAFACPRLVCEQVAEVAALQAVVGIKEYFGTVAEHISVNERAFRQSLAQPGVAAPERVAGLAGAYPDTLRADLLAAWEAAARAVENYPWDLSWRMRQYNSVRYDQGFAGEYWDHHFRRSLPTPWTTPSWESSRLSFYAVAVNDAAATPWMLKETARRLEHCLDYLDKAEGRLAEAVQAAGHHAVPDLDADLERQQVSVRVFSLLARSRLLHLRASQLAEELRARWDPGLGDRLAAVLEADLANALALQALAVQAAPGAFDLPRFAQTIESMQTELDACRRSAREWVTKHLL